ncbi:MAG: phytoene desaturase family protein [Chloroflexota bacterium]
MSTTQAPADPRGGQRVVVIGSGFGGLAVAVRLQARGYAVTILEAGHAPGGRASQIIEDGFTFDTGPSIVTAPELIHDIFAATGATTDDYVELMALDPYYRVYFADGRHYDYSGDAGAVQREMARFDPAGYRGYQAFMHHSARIHDRAFAQLAHQPFVTRRSFARVLPELAWLRADRPVTSVVADHLTDPALHAAYSFHPLFLGGNPFRASAIYSIIPYLERLGGVHFVRGGMYQLVRALARRLTELGGELVVDARASQIEVRGGRATGVRTADGRRWPAAAVVSNADVANTYARLVAPRHRRRWTDARLARQTYSMSLFLLYLGLDRTYEKLLHHTIIFGPRYRELLADIFDRHVLAEDFSLYVHAPTKTDPGMAPPGCESVYLLSPVPNLASGTDWKSAARPYRDRIIRFLEHEFGLEGLGASIRVERMFTPLDFRDRLHSHLGAAFSLAPTLLQSAYFRPHNRSEDVENLFLVGAGTHPGAGLPGTLLSAEITDRLVAASV